MSPQAPKPQPLSFWIRLGIPLAAVVLGLIAVLVLFSMFGEDTYQTSLARVKARSLDTPVMTYQLRNQGYPKDLNALVVDGYVDGSAILDPWGGRYQIDVDGPMHDGAKPDIFTVDPRDGKKIGNWGK